MMRFILLLSLGLLMGGTLLAQTPQNNCGSDVYANRDIKARMLRNRQEADPQALEAALNNRNTRYIPTAIHLVGDINGNGFADAAKAVEMLCRLNSDFADQNIMFYLAAPVNYIYNNTIYADAYSWASQGLMSNFKLSNTMNIFVNANVSRPVAGYYSPSYDLIFMANGYANGISTTITHEVGHFLTLPHTFYGWEGEDALTDYFNQNVPSSINGVPVEYVARTGSNSNCSFAADGFCDTEADYIAQRFNACSIQPNVNDPSGTPFVPDASLFMSYASDNCQNRFSQEQKNAMLLDIMARGWNSFTAPGSLDSVVATSISNISPLTNELVDASASATVRLEWSTTGASTASLWLIKVERVFNGVPIGIVYSESVSNQNYVDVPSSILGNNSQFRWSVKPMTPTYTCAGVSSFFTFETGLLSSQENNNMTLNSMSIFPNPNRTGQVKMKVQSVKDQEAQLRIYAFDGRLLYEQQAIVLNAGTQVLNLELGQLGTGHYMLLLNTEDAVLQEKLILVD